MEPYSPSPGHDLYNLLGKIMGAAELALDRVTDPAARAELNAILDMAEEAARMVTALSRTPAP
jgi:nitrogen-specific signal transduction histidine kinase